MKYSAVKHSAAPALPWVLPWALLLAGCAGVAAPPSHEPAPPPPRVEAQAGCGAERVQDHIGREYRAALSETLEAASGADRVRVIRPGDAVTLDYRADRLNVHLDDDDVISELGCG